MFTVPSALDERARPKGSRDPPGAEATWSFAGHKIIGKLTTVKGSMDNFLLALLCCEFSRSADDTAAVQQRYLRLEQLAAYLRLIERDGNDGVLGITRARADAAKTKMELGTSKEPQLLGGPSQQWPLGCVLA